MCLKPIALKMNSRKGISNEHRPCGKCGRCIMKKRKEWAFRLKWEAKDHPYSWFSMLTYNENTCPWINTNTGEIDFINRKKPYEPIDTDKLYYLTTSSEWHRTPLKSDIQKFLKNLRRQQTYWSEKDGFPDTQIRYYIVSEYGENNTERPHYHAVLFGVHPIVKDKMTMQKKIWNKGIVTAKPLQTQNSAGFMYLTKYLFKQRQLDIYPTKPFHLMSQKPYLGKRFETYAKNYLWTNRTLQLEENPHRELSEPIPQIYKEKIPELQRTIFRNNDILKYQEKEDNLIYMCNRLGKKPHDLLKLEKQAYYNRTYETEINRLRNQYTKKWEYLT